MRQLVILIVEKLEGFRVAVALLLGQLVAAVEGAAGVLDCAGGAGKPVPSADDGQEVVDGAEQDDATEDDHGIVHRLLGGVSI